MSPTQKRPKILVIISGPSSTPEVRIPQSDKWIFVIINSACLLLRNTFHCNECRFDGSRDDKVLLKSLNCLSEGSHSNLKSRRTICGGRRMRISCRKTSAIFTIRLIMDQIFIPATQNLIQKNFRSMYSYTE